MWGVWHARVWDRSRTQNRDTTERSSLLTAAGVPRKLRSMAHRDRPQSARWLLTLMVVLLVLGHVCELPAYAGLVIAPYSSEGRSGDGHGHEPEMACDPVDAVSNTTPVQVMNPVLETVQALPATGPFSGRLVTPSSIERSTRRPSRPPLFVLYASLLI